MTEHTSHDLDRRVRDLEREVRRAQHRTRTIALGAVALTLVAILHDTRTAAQRSDAKVTAPFEVVDDRGRVIFRVTDDGWSLTNANGKPVVAASNDEGSGSLTVSHVQRAGNTTQLTFTDDGRPKLELLLNSRVVTELGSSAEAAEGVAVGGLIASAKGGGGVALTGPAGGESAVSLGVTPGEEVSGCFPSPVAAPAWSWPLMDRPAFSRLTTKGEWP
jgi:hypothetical protein